MKKCFLAKVLMVATAFFGCALSSLASEQLVYSTDFTTSEWGTVTSGSASQNSLSLSTIQGDAISFNYVQAEANTSGSDAKYAPYTGYVRTAKQEGAYLEFSGIPSLTKINVVFGTTGGNRGLGVAVKAQDAAKWDTLSSEYQLQGATPKEFSFDEIKNASVRFFTLNAGQNGYLLELSLSGDVDAPEPPLVTGITPADGAVIPVNGSFTVAFSQPVSTYLGGITIGSVSPTSVTVNSADQTATVSYSGLSTDMTYTLTIPAGAFQNAEGVATPIASSASYISPDTKVPTLTQRSAVSGYATTDGFISLVYSEPVVVAGNVTIGSKTITPMVSGSSNIVYLSYSALPYAETVTITIPEGAITDLQGNKAAATSFDVNTEGNFDSKSLLVDFTPNASNVTASSTSVVSSDSEARVLTLTGTNSAASRSKGGFSYAFRCKEIEFPTLPSCGDFSIAVQNGSGSASASYTVQKKDGSSWTTIDNFILGANDYQVISSAAAQTSDEVTLRIVGSEVFWCYNISVSSFQDNDEAEDDGIAPTLTASSPVADAAGVAVNGNIILTMSKSVKVGEGAFSLNGVTLTPNVAASKVTLPYKNLAYSTNYTLTWTDGAVKDKKDRNIAAGSLSFTTASKPEVTPQLFNFVVAKDGSGNGTTIQSAFDAVPANNESKFLIFVKDGYYDFDVDGYASLAQGKNNVSLIGQSVDGVIFEGSHKSQTGSTGLHDYGTSDCQTLEILADNFYMENVTIKNVRNYTLAPLGVALKVYGDKCAFKNVRLLGYQDTHLTSNSGSDRQYYLNCDIHGTVDFIFGDGACYFENSTLYLEDRDQGDVINAPATSGEYGFVFNNCVITGASGQNGIYNLGRPWKNVPKSIWLNTTMDVLSSAGAWGDAMNVNPDKFGEYNSVNALGNPVDLTNRRKFYPANASKGLDEVTINPVLTEAEAQSYTRENVLGGTDDWNAVTKTLTTPAPANVTLTGQTLTWDNVDGAICYVILEDGVVKGFTTTPSYEYESVPASYGVIAVAEFGALSEVGGTSPVSTDDEQITSDASSSRLLVFNDIDATMQFAVQDVQEIEVFSSNGFRLASLRVGGAETVDASFIPSGVWIVRGKDAAGKTYAQMIVKR